MDEFQSETDFEARLSWWVAKMFFIAFRVSNPSVWGFIYLFILSIGKDIYNTVPSPDYNVCIFDSSYLRLKKNTKVR